MMVHETRNAIVSTLLLNKSLLLLGLSCYQSFFLSDYAPLFTYIYIYVYIYIKFVSVFVGVGWLSCAFVFIYVSCKTEIITYKYLFKRVSQ